MKLKLLMVIGISLFLFSCKKTTYFTADEFVKDKVSFNDIPNKKPIFANNENKAIMYARFFNVRSPLTATPLGNDSIKVMNYSLQAFKDVTIYAKLKGYPERIKLMQLDSVGALVEFNYKVSFTEKDQHYYTESGKWVQISNTRTIEGVTFSTTSPDPFYVKLQNIKANWNVYFSIKGGDNDSWHDMNPVHCREYIVLFTNMAYMFSNDEWQAAFLAYEGLYKNDGTTLLTRADRENLINRIINWSKFNTGLVGGGSAVGLGGGQTLGVAEYVLLSQYTEKWRDVFFHELGHCLDFSHSSNMTYPGNNKSFYQACQPTYGKLLRTKQFPYWNYKTLNTLYTYRGVPGILLETSANSDYNYPNF